MLDPVPTNTTAPDGLKENLVIRFAEAALKMAPPLPSGCAHAAMVRLPKVSGPATVMYLQAAQ